MRTDDHRDWRLSLGAYALGDLPAEERAALAAHLEGCAECRAELRSLEGVAALLPLADPARIEQPRGAPARRPRRADRGPDRRRIRQRGPREAAAPLPLGGRRRRRRRGRRGAPGDRRPADRRRGKLARPAGQIRLRAEWGEHQRNPRTPRLRHRDPHVREGHPLRHPLPRLPARRETGETFSAGSFRYRWGDDSEAELSSALDLSQAAEIGVHAGGRTFVAPVDQATALIGGADTDPA